mgnify:CR=1 FL=1
MNMLKESYEVKAFNQFPLGGCFDEAYISAAEAFGVSNIEYLLNDERWLYISDKGLAFSKYMRKPLRKFEEEKELVSEEYAPDPDEVVSLTIEALKSGRLVITKVVGIEAVNCQSKKKTQRSSTVHWILVYGYDEEKECFLVLEHLTNISARYMPCLASYDEYRKSYGKGYKKEPGKGIYILRKSPGTSHNRSLIEEYISCYSATEKERNWEKNAVSEFLDQIANGEDGMMILNELIKKYQRDAWIDERMGFKSSRIDEFIRELQLVRTNCIRLERGGSSEHMVQLKAHAEKAKNIYIAYCNDKAKLMERLKDEKILSP